MRRKLVAVPVTPAPRRQPARELELELYRSIFNSAHDAIAIIDGEGRYLEQNPAHERLIGYSDVEIVGQTPAIHLGEPGLARVAEELRRTGHFDGELPSRTRDGQQITLELSAFTMRDARGDVLCHVEVARDISERQRAGAELQARVRQQAAVARLGQQALAGMDLSALFQEAATSVAAMLSVEYAKVLELLPNGRELLLRAGVGWHPGMVGHATVGSGDDSQAGYTLRCSGPVVTEDLNSESRFDDQTLRAHNIASGMSVIIPLRGRPWGVLAANATQKRRFTADDVNFLVSVANVLAAAIDRKQAEEALQRIQQRLQLAQHASNLAIWDWDLLTGVVSWTDSSCDLYGVPTASLTRYSAWADYLHPDDRDWLMKRIEHAIAEHGEFDAEFRVVWPDGSTHWLAGRGQVLCNAAGTPVRMIGINIDVTERKRAEEALRQSEQRFRQAQRSANIGAYEWDLRSGQVTWSEELPVLRGLAPDGRFQSWLERIHPEDQARVTAVLQRAVREGTEFDLETRIVRDDGAVLWLVSRGQPFFEDGHPTHVAGVIMDVTARRQALELLQRSEKLAMIGRLAASIAHEINNPLESVTNLLYLIEHHPQLNAEVRDYVRLAASELGRVAHVSRQTLGFYRESTNPSPVNVVELLDDIIRLYAHKLERKRVQVVRDYHLAGKVPLFAAEIRQVFSNLLMNAMEAVDDNGTITVRLEHGADWSRPSVHGLRLLVADNGHGIRAEHLGMIFEPFFTTKGERGTGLGLWVTNGLVHKHGGSIRLRSSTRPERHGTVFAVFIPDVEAREN